MKIIFCRHHSICEPGILKSLPRLGHDVIEFMNDREPQDYDKDYMIRLATLIQQTTDVCAILSVCFHRLSHAQASLLVFHIFPIPWIALALPFTQRQWNILTTVCSCLTSCSLINSGTEIREIVFTHCLHVISSILTTLQYLTRI